MALYDLFEKRYTSRYKISISSHSTFFSARFSFFISHDALFDVLVRSFVGTVFADAWARRAGSRQLILQLPPVRAQGAFGVAEESSPRGQRLFRVAALDCLTTAQLLGRVRFRDNMRIWMKTFRWSSVACGVCCCVPVLFGGSLRVALGWDIKGVAMPNRRTSSCFLQRRAKVIFAYTLASM